MLKKALIDMKLRSSFKKKNIKYDSLIIVMYKTLLTNSSMFNSF